MILICAAVFTKVGAYLLGNFIVSLIAGTLAFVWLCASAVPYPLVLATLVTVLAVLLGFTLLGVVGALVAVPAAAAALLLLKEVAFTRLDRT
ncbi:hypothetical protein ACWEOE_28780 [Amycolatopsis sp. NPDC004368]